MKQIIILVIFSFFIINITACNTTSETNDLNSESQNTHDNLSTNNATVNKVASDNVQMQKSNPLLPTRLIENGTKINMHFGNAIIPGILNDSETASALIDILPYKVKMNRYSHDFCGVMNDPLPYNEENVHYGWLNGDIDFATNADYFTILFEDEENSTQYGHQVNIGVIDCELSKISKLQGNYDVLIELAE